MSFKQSSLYTPGLWGLGGGRRLCAEVFPGRKHTSASFWSSWGLCQAVFHTPGRLQALCPGPRVRRQEQAGPWKASCRWDTRGSPTLVECNHTPGKGYPTIPGAGRRTHASHLNFPPSWPPPRSLSQSTSQEFCHKDQGVASAALPSTDLGSQYLQGSLGASGSPPPPSPWYRGDGRTARGDRGGLDGRWRGLCLRGEVDSEQGSRAGPRVGLGLCTGL